MVIKTSTFIYKQARIPLPKEMKYFYYDVAKSNEQHQCDLRKCRSN